MTFQNEAGDKDDSMKPSFIIDYYNIENFENVEKFDTNLKKDFNLPLSKGCSRYLTQVTPKSQPQLSMDYKQMWGVRSFLLAYDHSAGYMRKELIGKSISVWDLNEELLYHIEEEAPELLTLTYSKIGNTQSCSVLHVSDEKLSPYYRPYEKAGEPFDVLKLLGASKLSYMGRGSVRDLPCRIYETILDSPPIIFGLQAAPEIDHYIVQYYLLQGQQDIEKLKTREDLQTNIDFWPAKIVLNGRNKNWGTVEFLDQLDVYDFYWSLDGWDKKASQLFMASECFDDDDEQLRLEMALAFDRVHKGAVAAEDKALLPFNKFRLEFELINDLVGLFQISKLHLVEYELKLSPSHVNLDLVIGDRRDYRNLVYVGQGRLPNEDSYRSNRLVQTGISEEACVMLSSLITDISMVLYCSGRDMSDQCLAIYDENEPTFEHDQGDKQTPSCHVYWFTSTGVPKRATEMVLQKSASLHKHPFEFVAKAQDGLRSITLDGEVKYYDISREIQLVSIDNYKFAFDDDISSGSNQNVRSLNTITYRSESDCARMCNIDVTCRSYSYCSSKQDHPCILSKLDVRSSKIRDQLVRSSSPIQTNSRITVNGDGGDKYQLQLVDQCDIYERNYLNMFRQTDEIIRLDGSIANQYQSTPTTFECAKQSVDLETEAKSHNHHIAMFAYCATLNICLLDQNLFTVSSGDQPDDDGASGEEDELICRLYRKKYQTYFEVSPEVLVIEPEKQVALDKLKTVEECARACWVKFGQVCASFDYCSPSTCLINQIGTQSGEAKSEARSGCLHYERDLELEKLRKSHLNLPGQFLEAPEENGTTTFFGWIVNIITYVLVGCAFLYGLVLGRQVNDKLEGPAGANARQSIASLSNARPSRRETLFGFQRFSAFGNARGSTDTSAQARDVQFDSNNAIKLDVINRNGDSDNEPLEVDF